MDAVGLDHAGHVTRPCQRYRGEPVALSRPAERASWSGPRDTPGALPPRAALTSRHGYCGCGARAPAVRPPSITSSVPVT
jgi:hypothetical protein